MKQKNFKQKMSKKDEKRMEQKTISIMTLGVTVVIGWDKIVNTLNSFSEGVGAVLNSLPPIILLGIALSAIWVLGNKK